MTEHDRRISEIIAEQPSRLRAFNRRRVPDTSDAPRTSGRRSSTKVEANRLLMPIEHVTGCLFRVARNCITDLFRKKKPGTFSGRAVDRIGLANDQVKRPFHIAVEPMVAADARDPLIEALVIRRCTASDEDARAVSGELSPDAPANTFSASSHDCDSAVKTHVRNCTGP
jgi:hypothetical protein